MLRGRNASTALANDPRLVGLNVEELMSIQVTSASKMSQPLVDTASALHVIQAADICRSAETTIPDLLRGVPGL